MNTHDLKQLFDNIHRVFPLAEAGIPPGLDLTHTIYTHPRDGLTLEVYWLGAAWNVCFGSDTVVDLRVLAHARERIETDHRQVSCSGKRRQKRGRG